MTHYVIGFLFDGNKVVLIQKKRPAWQAGLLNGVGGHVEREDKSAHHAMVREFKEETGATSYTYDWTHFATLAGEDWRVRCYFAYGNSSVCHTVTDEEILVVPIVDLEKFPTIDNIPWLIEMARAFIHQDHPYHHLRVEYIREGAAA